VGSRGGLVAGDKYQVTVPEGPCTTLGDAGQGWGGAWTPTGTAQPRLLSLWA